MQATVSQKLVSTVIVVFVCVLFLRIFVVEGFVVSGDSMEPTIHSGDFVFINKLAYWFRSPARGDIIVVIPRTYPNKVVKRIVGLPGERFQIENNTITLNRIIIRDGRLGTGVVLSEPYLMSSTTPAVGTTLIQLDPQEYFALGDNRQVSIDSRELGPVDKWSIKGKVIGTFNFKALKYVGF
jgi:signal peptidase I